MGVSNQPDLCQLGRPWDRVGVAREDPELVSTDRAARAVGVSRSTLWRWIALGYVTPTSRTAGRHLRWDVNELREQIRKMNEG